MCDCCAMAFSSCDSGFCTEAKLADSGGGFGHDVEQIVVNARLNHTNCLAIWVRKRIYTYIEDITPL